jgi:Tfp pilus assembly protein PilX
MKRNKSSSGQALLIVLLSLAVVLTIVLYIISRSITDISISSKEEDSLRAFSAAEAGIERALIIGQDTGNLNIDNATFNADISSFAQGSNAVIYPFDLKSGEYANFWFVGHNANGTLGCGTESCFRGNQMKVCWGEPGTSNSNAQTPAVEVTVVYANTAGDYSTLRTKRVASDPNSSRSNSFVDPDTTCTIDGQSFAFAKNVNFNSLGISNYGTNNVLQYATVRMLYNTTNPHRIGIDVSATSSLLPSQGVKVESLGSYANANRKIEAYQLHPIAPSIFNNVIFTSGGITK